MMSVGPQPRDQATAALFQRIIREKAQERELLKCPRCYDLMEALPLEIDEQGNQTIWWVCKSTGKKKCDFPLDMPLAVFWVKRSPADIKDGYMPRPKIELLPDRYKYLYPALFANTMRPSSQSRCGSVTSRSSTATLSSRSSLHTCDMPLSGLPSPLTPATNDWEGCATNSSSSQRGASGDLSSRNSCEPSPSTSAIAELSRDDAKETLIVPKTKTVSRSLKIVPDTTSETNQSSSLPPIPRNNTKRSDTFDSETYRAVRKRVDERIARRNKNRTRNTVLEGQSLLTLYSQIKNMDLSKLNVEELESILEKCDMDMRSIGDHFLSKRMRREQDRADVSRDFYQTLDISKIENQVQERTPVDRLNMLYSLRAAHDGNSLMAALGAESPQRQAVIVVEQRDPGAMQEFIKARMKDMATLILKKKKEGSRLLMKAAQETNGRALSKKKAVSLITDSNNDLSAEENERRKAAKLEYEHKTKALVQSKVAAYMEAKRKKILASKDLKQKTAQNMGYMEPLADPCSYSQQSMCDLFENSSVSEQGDLFLSGDNNDLQSHHSYSYGDLEENPFSNLELSNNYLDFSM